MIFLPFLVLLFLNICQANETNECVGCKNVNYLKYFPSKELEGIWYVNALYDATGFGFDQDCIQLKFNKVNCTSFDIKYCLQQAPDTVECLPE